jgi:hypothetical protein
MPPHHRIDPFCQIHLKDNNCPTSLTCTLVFVVIPRARNKKIFMVTFIFLLKLMIMIIIIIFLLFSWLKGKESVKRKETIFLLNYPFFSSILVDCCVIDPTWWETRANRSLLIQSPLFHKHDKLFSLVWWQRWGHVTFTISPVWYQVIGIFIHTKFIIIIYKKKD